MTNASDRVESLRDFPPPLVALGRAMFAPRFPAGFPLPSRADLDRMEAEFTAEDQKDRPQSPAYLKIRAKTERWIAYLRDMERAGLIDLV